MYYLISMKMFGLWTSFGILGKLKWQMNLRQYSSLQLVCWGKYCTQLSNPNILMFKEQSTEFENLSVGQSQCLKTIGCNLLLFQQEVAYEHWRTKCSPKGQFYNMTHIQQVLYGSEQRIDQLQFLQLWKTFQVRKILTVEKKKKSMTHFDEGLKSAQVQTFKYLVKYDSMPRFLLFMPG